MYHPDNSNGDTREEFDRLRRARDVLQDSSTRSSYIKFHELTDGAPATTELFESWQRKGKPCSPGQWVEQQHENGGGDTSDPTPSGEDTGKKQDRLRETKGHDDLRDTRDSRRKNNDSSEDPIPDPINENEGEDDSDDGRPSPPPSFDDTDGEEDVGPTGRFDNVNWGDPSIGDFTPSEDERGPPTGDSPTTPYGEDVPVGMPDPEEEE